MRWPGISRSETNRLSDGSRLVLIPPAAGRSLLEGAMSATTTAWEQLLDTTRVLVSETERSQEQVASLPADFRRELSSELTRLARLLQDRPVTRRAS